MQTPATLIGRCEYSSQVQDGNFGGARSMTAKSDESQESLGYKYQNGLYCPWKNLERDLTAISKEAGRPKRGRNNEKTCEKRWSQQRMLRIFGILTG